MFKMDRNLRVRGHSNIMPCEDDEQTHLLSEMEESKIGASTDVLVDAKSARKFPQYLAAICATLGAFAMGATLGWTSPAGLQTNRTLSDGSNYNLSYLCDTFCSDESQLEDCKNQESWIGALMPLGAAVMSFPIGILIDLVGRKTSMLGLVLPFCLGWALMIWANGPQMLLAGRFFLGMAGGAFAVAAPVYTSEIAQIEIRGTLGSYFQLMVTLGILFVYVFGSFVSLYILTIICGVVPLVFALSFFFMPETPLYLISKGRKADAEKSLQFFRGKNYNIEHELRVIEESFEKSKREKVSFFKSFSARSAKMALVLSLGLMLIQQFSGINAVIFYTTNIFAAAGSDIDPAISTIIVGVVQFVSTFISTLVVDRLGRKILLLLSSSVMCICTLLLGVFFYLQDHQPDVSANIGWLPLLSLCLFMVAFSLGFGPIPWMIVAELFPPKIKGAAGSIAACFNWILAFLVTKFYSDMNIAMGTGPTFFFFMSILACGFVFVFFFLKETKGKTLDEILRQLGDK